MMFIVSLEEPEGEDPLMMFIVSLEEPERERIVQLLMTSGEEAEVRAMEARSPVDRAWWEKRAEMFFGLARQFHPLQALENAPPEQHSTS
jgi:hypothetical protein